MVVGSPGSISGGWLGSMTVHVWGLVPAKATDPRKTDSQQAGQEQKTKTAWGEGVSGLTLYFM